MKKAYNFRLETTLIKEVDQMPGTRTGHVTNALQQYLQNGTQKNYNVDIVDLLKNQIGSLERDKEFLKNQNQALMISSIPLLARIKLKLLGKPTD